MRSRVWIQLILLAAVLAVLVFMLRRPREEVALPSAFDGIDPGTVLRLRWLGPDGERTLARSQGGWVFIGTPASDPVWREDRGNERLAIELLRNLHRFRAQRLLDPDRLEEYGLLSPQRGLVLETSGGRADTLWIGDAAPIDRGRYAAWSRLGTQAAVLDGFLVEKFVVAGDDNLRDPHLGHLSIGLVDTAWAETAGGTFALIPGKDAWRVALPTGLYLADSLAGKRVVNTLLRLQAIHFLHRSDHPSSSDLGLDPPRARWILGRGQIRDTFLVGGRLVPEGRMYIQAKGRPPALTLHENWSYLVGDATDFRNPNLFGSDESEWEEVRLVASGKAIGRLVREDDVWTPLEGLPEIGGPDPLRLWGTKVANLARLRFVAYRDPPGEEPDLLIIIGKRDGHRDTLKIATATGGAVAEGPHQPGVWGNLAPGEVAFWIGVARRRAGG